ncbi:UTP--glucose-1-phosphate uridylyltransferase [Raineyella antarctica]|uniref:UTP--glucose-1-phosphate uridylyltransferase n=1 Tax=Raineyella antarctica TaxID=1577474 RepID=A0A1G6GEE5_9ACTN|nr:UTP--glucose-1-phosphate uridylyltransferase [Raineyella antarctica]SDB80334.1 UTP--glucose-1-phosphate uridylyltransferase [Raineyella antarctica]
MTTQGLERAQQKMRDAGVAENAITVFTHYYGKLAEGATGIVPESSIRPVTELPALADLLAADRTPDTEALDRTVIIKLNGGLGTSMGMTKAKSLVPVRSGRTFLDLIVAQVMATRAEHGVRLPLILMDSFATSADTMAELAASPALRTPGVPLEFIQNQEPKLLVDDLAPVEWPADPTLEWCPPGHGDLYTALQGSGVLAQLLAAGYRYASVSNADNLGAAPSAELAAWFASTGAPFAMEVCERTRADRKGGHLAVREEDGRLVLREKAQTAEEDEEAFGDIERHRFFNTNNLWLDLQQLSDTLAERDGVLGLPLIRNRKRVDPTDRTSPEVYQIETAMGAAIEVFEGSQAIVVPRDRFLPVKTTNDLLLLRSDVYRVQEDGTLVRVDPTPPLVQLAPGPYQLIADFEQRFPHGAPSLREAGSLTVEGDWTFGHQVTIRGDVVLPPTDRPRTVPAGSVLDGHSGLPSDDGE